MASEIAFIIVLVHMKHIDDHASHLPTTKLGSSSDYNECPDGANFRSAQNSWYCSTSKTKKSKRAEKRFHCPCAPQIRILSKAKDPSPDLSQLPVPRTFEVFIAVLSKEPCEPWDLRGNFEILKLSPTRLLSPSIDDFYDRIVVHRSCLSFRGLPPFFIASLSSTGPHARSQAFSKDQTFRLQHAANYAYHSRGFVSSHDIIPCRKCPNFPIPSRGVAA